MMESQQSKEGAMDNSLQNTVSPRVEMVAYETLWAIPNQTLKTIAGLFKQYQGLLPSEILEKSVREYTIDINGLKEKVEEFLKSFNDFSVCVYGTFHYPERLRIARYPIELFYYKGDIGRLDMPCVSVVGSRQCSEDGVKRAKKLARGLAEAGYTVVSGLAVGVDTAAMTAAMEAKGNVIGVIGTPINQYYPTENKELQDRTAKEKLLISQVPFYRYKHEPFSAKRRYFPQRNETMAAISEATIIVEAGETSGTLTQARACLQQGRKLFILNACFERTDITWPQYYADKGAFRVKDFNDIFDVLGDPQRGKASGAV